jgi:arsenate reductase
MASEITVFFNARCSKCRQARDLLLEAGASFELIEYLESPPSRSDLERILSLLGTDDPRVILRSKEALYQELGLGDANRDTQLDAITEHPGLLERPIVIRGERAVVARPPEKLLDLL